jgi:hypothetical protein
MNFSIFFGLIGIPLLIIGTAVICYFQTAQGEGGNES